MTYKILVIDDDANILELLRLYLSHEGYILSFASDGSKGLDAFRNFKPDLVILDIMLPIINGWEVCQMIRRISDVPILMLTSKDGLEDKLMGFDLGADDYVVKPFDPKEVIARSKALLKRISSETDNIKKNPLIELGDLRVNIDNYEVFFKDNKIDLKPREMQLLFFFLKNPNIVFTRDQLLEKVWGHEFYGETRTVDVHIKRLREKLGNNSLGFKLKTIWGIGYKLEVNY
ncbi:response regulator transcription factor [Desulfitibacter alkalitolerans]|uniref:response regulator transcription factor n=1 Tax=Desulfitibacter alkalitolerans TaxID=264641 RepID=UPI0004823A0F|nr:response regulator transcription factor [Desulfitibacter alkalitolerans]